MSPSSFACSRVAALALLVALAPTPAPAQVPLSSWSSVTRLAAGTEIVVTTGPSGSATPRAVLSHGFVLRADELGLTTINLGDLPVSRLVGDVLRDAAMKHPEYFEAARQGRSRTLKFGVGLGPGGVSVDRRRIAGLQQIVERIDRSDVIQVLKRRTIRRGSAKRVLQGAGIGFVLTLIAAGNGGTGPNYCTEHEKGCLAVAGAGMAAGAAAGYWGGKDQAAIEDVVVYRRS